MSELKKDFVVVIWWVGALCLQIRCVILRTGLGAFFAILLQAYDVRDF